MVENYKMNHANVEENITGDIDMNEDDSGKGSFAYCPAHLHVEKETAVTSNEIKNLIEAHKQLHGLIQEVKATVNDELLKRVPKWVLVAITSLASLCTGLIVNRMNGAG